MHSRLPLAITWLTLSCYGLLAFAALWWLASVPGFDWTGRMILDMSDWPIDGGHDDLSRDARFLSAIGSSLLAALALALLLIVVPEVKRGNFTVIRGAIIAVIAWYTIDSIGCIFAGVYSNVVFNTIYLSAILPPMLLIKAGSD